MTATIGELDLDFIWDMAIPCEMNNHRSNDAAEYRLVHATCPNCKTELDRPILSCVRCKVAAETGPVKCLACGYVGKAKDYDLSFERL